MIIFFCFLKKIGNVELTLEEGGLSVFGGQLSKPNEWLVAFVNIDDKQFFCGGSLISVKHVLSGEEFIIFSTKSYLKSKFSFLFIQLHTVSSTNIKSKKHRHNTSQLSLVNITLIFKTSLDRQVMKFGILFYILTGNRPHSVSMLMQLSLCCETLSS